MNQERGAAVALPRHSGTTLLYSFLGRGGEEEKDVWEALWKTLQSSTCSNFSRTLEGSFPLAPTSPWMIL